MTSAEIKIKEAREVAIKAHGDQAYDEIFPYSKHLDDVVRVLREFGFGADMLCAGYLHDAIEDGGVSYKDIKRYFGDRVAEAVYGVTDELGRDRAERKRKTLPKTAANPDAIVLKLADRIANVKHGGKIDMYQKEHPAFRSALKEHSPLSALPLWDELERLLA